MTKKKLLKLSKQELIKVIEDKEKVYKLTVAGYNELSKEIEPLKVAIIKQDKDIENYTNKIIKLEDKVNKLVEIIKEYV